MSMRTIARSSSNRNSASALASSVLPTPVGPRNRNEPVGRSGSEMPGPGPAHRVGHRLRPPRTGRPAACRARPPSAAACRSRPRAAGRPGCRSRPTPRRRRRPGPTSSLTIGRRRPPARPAVAAALAAASWPPAAASASSASSAGISPYISRDAASKSPSRWARSAWPAQVVEPLLQLADPVQARPSPAPSGRSARSAAPAGRPGRRAAAPAAPCWPGRPRAASASSSIFIRSTARCSSSISTGRESISIRSRDAASSTRSMALSGRNRAVM